MVSADPRCKFVVPTKFRELLHHLGVVDHATVVHDEDDPDAGALPIYPDESGRNR